MLDRACANDTHAIRIVGSADTSSRVAEFRAIVPPLASGRLPAMVARPASEPTVLDRVVPVPTGIVHLAPSGRPRTARGLSGFHFTLAMADPLRRTARSISRLPATIRAVLALPTAVTSGVESLLAVTAMRHLASRYILLAFCHGPLQRCRPT
jgi:hypothetical protein